MFLEGSLQSGSPAGAWALTENCHGLLHILGNRDVGIRSSPLKLHQSPLPIQGNTSTVSRGCGGRERRGIGLSAGLKHEVALWAGRGRRSLTPTGTHTRARTSTQIFARSHRTQAPPAEPVPTASPERPGPGPAPPPAARPAAPRRPHQRAARPRVRAGGPGPAAALPRPLPLSAALRAPPAARSSRTAFASPRPGRGSASAQNLEADPGLHGARPLALQGRSVTALVTVCPSCPRSSGLCREVLPGELESQIDDSLVAGR